MHMKQDRNSLELFRRFYSTPVPLISNIFCVIASHVYSSFTFFMAASATFFAYCGSSKYFEIASHHFSASNSSTICPHFPSAIKVRLPPFRLETTGAPNHPENFQYRRQQKGFCQWVNVSQLWIC